MVNGVTPIAGNLSDLLQPRGQQSPMALLASIARMAQEDPEGLAQLFASKGIRPPEGDAGVLFGGTGGDALTGSQAGVIPPTLPTAPPPAQAQVGPLTLPSPAPALPAQKPVVTPANAPGAQSPLAKPEQSAGEKLLEALSGLVTPPPPAVPPPPGAVAPRGGGPAADPRLIAQLFQLLQSGAAPATPTLGQLISGQVPPTATPTLSL